MARLHLNMGVPYFIDRDFEELANPRGLQVGLCAGVMLWCCCCGGGGSSCSTAQRCPVLPAGHTYRLIDIITH
jgi:hypothetical protein